MQKPSQIDGAWFKQQFDRAGLSMREVARRLPAGKHGKPMDPSALSRALNGTRKMSISEAKNIARILKLSEAVVVQKALGADSGASMTPAQMPPVGAPDLATAADTPQHDAHGSGRLRRHPAWGALKGTTIVMPGVDLTEPTAPEWGRLDGE